MPPCGTKTTSWPPRPAQYAALSSYIQQTRKLRHDFRQHLRVISGLVAKGDLEALNAYLRDVSGQEQEQVRFIFANPALNALAGYYESRAQSQGVELEWSVSLPETLNIPDAEICVLLGNLLENALDGAGTMPPGQAPGADHLPVEWGDVLRDCGKQL